MKIILTLSFLREKDQGKESEEVPNEGNDWLRPEYPKSWYPKGWF